MTNDTTLSVEDWHQQYPGVELTFWKPADDDSWLCGPDGLDEMNSALPIILGLVPPFASLEEANEKLTPVAKEHEGFTGDNYFTSSPYGTCTHCGVSVEQPEQQSA